MEHRKAPVSILARTLRYHLASAERALTHRTSYRFGMDLKPAILDAQIAIPFILRGGTFPEGSMIPNHASCGG